MKNQRMPLGNISVNFVCAMIASLEQLDTDPEPLLRRYNLNHTFLGTPGSRISIPKFMRLGNEAIRLSEQAHLGLLMGKNMTVSNIGLSGFAAMTAPTLRGSLRTLVEFELLNSQNSRGHSTFYVENGQVICQFYSIRPYNQFNYFVVDSMLSTWYHFAKWLTEEEGLIHRIEIEHTNTINQMEYENLFGCPVYLGASRNAFILKKGCEYTPSIYRNRASHQSAVLLCRQEKEQIEKGRTIKDRVTDLISTQLDGVPPSINEIAQRMGIAGWTLRRRLRAEGLQYREILDQTRSDLAKSYVLDTLHNFTEIAFLLGFSSPAAFQRAFKRWTNTSPGDYRKKVP